MRLRARAVATLAVAFGLWRPVPPTITGGNDAPYGVPSQRLSLAGVALWGRAFAQGTISDLPRNETLIVENPEGTIKNAGWFNIWAINAGGQSTGLHQLGDGHLLVHRSRRRASTACGTIRSPPRSRSTTPTSPR